MGEEVGREAWAAQVLVTQEAAEAAEVEEVEEVEAVEGVVGNAAHARALHETP